MFLSICFNFLNKYHKILIIEPYFGNVLERRIKKKIKKDNFISTVSYEETIIHKYGKKKEQDRYLKFDKNKADEMREILLVAHKLIKNPDMLGAFSDVESISNEVSKLKFANKSLDHISEMIQEKKSNKK